VLPTQNIRTLISSHAWKVIKISLGRILSSSSSSSSSSPSSSSSSSSSASSSASSSSASSSSASFSLIRCIQSHRLRKDCTVL
jgi:hypothetical protein